MRVEEHCVQFVFGKNVCLRSVMKEWRGERWRHASRDIFQTTVSGVEHKVTSGFFPMGVGCAAADDTRANTPSTAHQIIGNLQTCVDIEHQMLTDGAPDCYPGRFVSC